MSHADIPVLARECKLLAARIEREFGTATVSRSATLRDAIGLQSQAVRLGNQVRAWFDEMAKSGA